LLIGDEIVGWVSTPIVSALHNMAGIRCPQDRVVLDDPAALPTIAHALAERGYYRWRDEAFDVRARPGGPVLAMIDRGALPSFGIQAAGVHVNGLVGPRDGLRLWVARRARNKHLDPGKLDNVVAGGVPAGLGLTETLIKEAEEEAAIPHELAAAAVQVGVIEYAMERPEGLRRDILYCYDLSLPEDFLPMATDGEVEAFELWPISRVLETVRETDDFKFNVDLVLIDLFLRLGLIAAA
jgi:8-oxo-dGTP pyrophosphatase MutT (NUDIX family)